MNLKSDNDLCLLQDKSFNITVIQVYAQTSNAEEAEVEWFYKDLQDLLELKPQKDVLFIIGDWNLKVGSQEIPGVTDKFVLEYEISKSKSNRVFREYTMVIANTLFNNTGEDSTHGHHHMVNTKIRLITFFAAKDREPLYSQQEQDWELPVAGSMNSLLPNSDLN